MFTSSVKGRAVSWLSGKATLGTVGSGSLSAAVVVDTLRVLSFCLGSAGVTNSPAVPLFKLRGLAVAGLVGSMDSRRRASERSILADC